MKFQGRELTGDYRRRVDWPRPDGSVLSLQVGPLPLGFPRLLREHGITAPEKPTRIARDAAGKPVRDAQGLAVLVPDVLDATYQLEVERHHQRVAVAMVAEALQGDANLSWDSPWRPAEADWRGATDRLHAELEQAGCTAGDLLWLCEEIGRLSNLWPEHLREARAGFFSADSLRTG